MRPFLTRMFLNPPLNLLRVPSTRIQPIYRCFMFTVGIFGMTHTYGSRHVATVPMPRPLVALLVLLARLFAGKEIGVRGVRVGFLETVPVSGVPVEVPGKGAKSVVVQEVGVEEWALLSILIRATILVHVGGLSTYLASISLHLPLPQLLHLLWSRLV